jgi:exoribonuclease R
VGYISNCHYQFPTVTCRLSKHCIIKVTRIFTINRNQFHISNINTPYFVLCVEIIQAPTFKTLAQGKITRILGDYMDEGVETEAALYRNGIPVDFSEETLAQTKQLPTAVSVNHHISTTFSAKM